MLTSGCGAAYADLMLDISVDESTKSAMAISVYNGSYALGWALGPVLGGILLDISDGSDEQRFASFATVIALLSLSISIFFLVLAQLGLSAI